MGKRKLIMRLIMFLVIAALPFTCYADFYQYTDNKGVINFVDDPNKIPAKYRVKAKVRNEKAMTATNTTAVTLINNNIVIPVMMNNKGITIKANMLLDTGCSGVIVYSNLANRLNLQSNNISITRSKVADGRQVNKYDTQINYIQVGNKSISNPAISIMHNNETNYDGLLGNSFLSNFHFRIDYANSRIVWD